MLERRADALDRRRSGDGHMHCLLPLGGSGKMLIAEGERGHARILADRPMQRRFPLSALARASRSD